MIASARALPIPGNASSSDFEAELISSKTAAGFGAAIGVAAGFGAVTGAEAPGFAGVVAGDVVCAETTPAPAKITKVAIVNTAEIFILGSQGYVAGLVPSISFMNSLLSAAMRQRVTQSLFQAVWHDAAGFHQLRHDLLVQPDIHLC